MPRNIPYRPQDSRQAKETRFTNSFTCSDSTIMPLELDGEDSARESEEKPLINDKGIEESLSWIHWLTLNLVMAISKAITLDQFSWPQVADTHIWFSECFHLFRLALGFPEETLYHAFRRLEVNLQDISVYLRALVAADVFNRILVAEHSDLPLFSKQWVDASFDPKIRKYCPISQSEIKKIAVAALSNQEQINARLSSLPQTLTRELFEALNPLLLSYKSTEIDREAGKSCRQKLEEQYGKKLMEIYQCAIDLRKALDQKESAYSFFWIDAGEDFDERIMDPEIRFRRDESYLDDKKRKCKVIATILPGICRNDDNPACSIHSTEPTREKNIILRALVYIGNPDGFQS